ncbi:hypothetical protein [Rickettsiella massiliensis]|uniref:hypothetical protein n=1 Tax=Rickettsiella massiliensis TaxID=676517 RepID=UPI00029AAA73|nr:hypothetical protein [Rickettsiella massiliensis]
MAHREYGASFFSYSLYTLFNSDPFYLAVLSLFVLVMITSFIFSVFSSLLMGLFLTAIRYSGVAFVYNLGFSGSEGSRPSY